MQKKRRAGKKVGPAVDLKALLPKDKIEQSPSRGKSVEDEKDCWCER
jgi:hypothetical protein